MVKQSIDVSETWRAHFGDAAPIGHVLREALPDRWLRIHSLPESQRYAAQPAEYATLLARHNAVARELLGDDADAILFLHFFGDPAELEATFGSFVWAAAAGIGDAELVAHAWTAGDPEIETVLVAACRVRWTPGAWDALMRDVADWNTPSVVVFNPTSGEVYAPYDGGADVFVADPQRVAALKARWSGWLSSRPDGR